MDPTPEGSFGCFAIKDMHIPPPTLHPLLRSDHLNIKDEECV